ncbi:hypothetical protein F5X96DRAFT_90964 [Biscogniauxia mediterranea]|nr:hypothetical protein F5X96DRAFT_90964 [Biscogniauxia mediterranea]
MTNAPLSPKRRHILSSINPEEPPTSPKIENNDAIPEVPIAEPTNTEEQASDARDRKTTKFRFKSHRSRSHRSSRHSDGDRDRDRSRDEGEPRSTDNAQDDHDRESSSHRRHRHRHRHHHHHHRRHKRLRTRSRSPTPPNPYEPPPLSADAAFRESLFDAMADDEGATYWEAVYGQPIHVYGRPSQGGEGEDELERMDDDEYAAYVRQRMWEKTHQGLLEERARREARRREREAKEKEAERLTREMERSLRRGEERRRRRGLRGRWEAYLAAWAAWDGTTVGAMAWPVESGRREDVADAAAVREFFVTGIDPAEVGEAEFLARLKEERVRWHPDKIQQRLGGGGNGVDEGVMRDVTAVFQIVDKLWSDTRAKAKKEEAAY